MNSKRLRDNVRFYVLFFSVSLSVIVYLFVIQAYSGTNQNIKLTQLYALISVAFLYITLLAGPFCYTFKNYIPRAFENQYIKSRRALGVSAFYFALLHAFIAFFGQLGGFEGLFYLTERYLFAIGISTLSLFILFLLAITSFDKMIDKLTFPVWRTLQRFVYLAGILILIHALLLGSHFINLSTTIPLIFFLGISFLFLLESLRFDAKIKKHWHKMPTIGISFGIVLIALGYLYIQYVLPSEDNESALSVHSQHMQNTKGKQIKNTHVDFKYPEKITANQKTQLQFTIRNTTNNKPITYYDIVQEKPLHLIIVDGELHYFKHQHPSQNNETFTDSVIFPHNGDYHLYLDFQPSEGTEQQKTLTLSVGDQQKNDQRTYEPDKELTKSIGDYQISLRLPEELRADKLTRGEQVITFRFSDAEGNPVTNLKRYLGSYGHMVMINTKTFAYLHVHPTTLVTSNDTGGPDVSFYPLAITGPITPGIYRIFGEFKPNDQLTTVDFTVEVK